MCSSETFCLVKISKSLQTTLAAEAHLAEGQFLIIIIIIIIHLLEVLRSHIIAVLPVRESGKTDNQPLTYSTVSRSAAVSSLLCTSNGQR
jgi:hypothetical protein